MKTKFLVSNGTYNSGAVIVAIKNERIDDILWTEEASIAAKKFILRELSQSNVLDGTNVVYYTNMMDNFWALLDKMMKKMAERLILDPSDLLLNVLRGADTIGIYLCISADTRDKFLSGKMRLEEGSVYCIDRRLLYETPDVTLLDRHALEKNNISTDVLWLLKAYEITR